MLEAGAVLELAAWSASYVVVIQAMRAQEASRVPEIADGISTLPSERSKGYAEVRVAQRTLPGAPNGRAPVVQWSQEAEVGMLNYIL